MAVNENDEIFRRSNGSSGYASIDKPWLKYYPGEAIDLPIPKSTVYEYLYDNNKDHLDDIALDYFGNRISYKSLFSKIKSTAGGLRALNVDAGDIITVISPTLPETVYLLYAANYIGAAVNLLDPRTNESRIRDSIIATKSKCVFVIDASDYPQKIVHALSGDKSLADMIIAISPATSLPVFSKVLFACKSRQNMTAGLKSWKRFVSDGIVAGDFEPVGYKPDTLAFIDYTGGTTGIPKGALLSNDCVNGVAFQYKISKIYHIERNQTMLNVMPIFLAYGINMLNMSLSQGVTNIIIPKFDPNKFDEYLIKYHPNHFFGVPSFYESLMESKKMDGISLEWLYTPACGGDSANTQLEARINRFLKEHKCPANLTKGYGMTELSSSAASCADGINDLGSVGIPLIKNTISVFNEEDGKELPYSEIGEIAVSGPTIMLGYLNNQEETAKAIRIHKDGKKWLHTGDLGKMTPDGMIYVINRKKRVVIRPDGHNVFPSQIENVLSKHPAVKECAVIGVPSKDTISGSWTKAIIVLKPEYKGKEKAIIEELKQLCLKELPERDVAHFYATREKLPYTGAGKIDYQRLEKENSIEH